MYLLAGERLGKLYEAMGILPDTVQVVESSVRTLREKIGDPALLTYLPTYLLTYLPTYLPTYLLCAR